MAMLDTGVPDPQCVSVPHNNKGAASSKPKESSKVDWDALESKALKMFENACARATAQGHRTPSELNGSTLAAAEMLEALVALRAQRQAEDAEKPYPPQVMHRRRNTLSC